MSATTIEYKGSGDHRVDMHWLQQALEQDLSPKEISKSTLKLGSEQVLLGDVFSIDGKLSASELSLKNSTNHLDYVGIGLPSDKTLLVEGDCGHYLGQQLAGGRLICNGSALHYAGCNMQAGSIEIMSNAGDYVGGSIAGNKRGMAGGRLLIHGNSGDFTGDLMRRGLLMVAGNIGDHCGNRMIAGTITSMGSVGENAGNGMRRGTLLFPSKPASMATGFNDCGRHSLGFLPLLMRDIRAPESAFQALHPMRRRVQRYLGDASVDGQGEILIWIG